MLTTAALTISLAIGHAIAEDGSKTDKILLGTHIGNATIVSLAGVDTSQAVVKFQRKLDDFVEECSRNVGANEDGTVPSEKVADCTKPALQSGR